MAAFIEQSAPEGTFCHDKPVEVDIALTLPLTCSHNAVLIYSCGKPRAVLESTAERFSWTFVPLDRP